MERTEKAKSPEMETAGLPPNNMKRFYVNGRHLLREIAGLYVLIPAGETDAPQNRITGRNAARHRKLCTGRAARRTAARGFRCGKNGRKGGIK